MTVALTHSHMTKIVMNILCDLIYTKILNT
jgi:hypothetical protein